MKFSSICGLNFKPPILWLSALGAIAFCAAADTDYRVRTSNPAPAGLAPVLSRLEAKNDRWLGESDYEAIEKIVKKSGLSLSGLASRFSSVAVQEFKIVFSERPTPLEPVARLRVLFEIAGTTPQNRFLSITGTWDMLWRYTDRWRLEKLEKGVPRESSVERKQFTDVTARALNGQPGWNEQLALGTDHWRSVLDEASGIDVYGHNGISVGDYNGDGLEDFYVSQPSGLPNRLFRNNGNATFQDATQDSGLAILDDTRMSLFLDYDNDGDQDLIVVTATAPLLFVNDGQGHFARKTDSGLSIPDNAAGSLTSIAAADYDRDGFVDVYISAYDLWTPGRKYNSPTPYHDARNGPPNYLFRNRGDGTWEDVTARSGMSHNNDRFSFAASWGDYDSDGDPDLYVANDFGRNNLYRNNGNGTFSDVAAAAGVEDLGAGMSVDWGDYDNDGDLDLYIGNMWSSAGQRLTSTAEFAAKMSDTGLRSSFQRHARGNSLFRNNGNGTFTDISDAAGVSMGRWAWASGFVDIDNDGRQDLFVQNGYITGEDTKDL